MSQELLKVLLVDDEESLREGLAKYLNRTLNCQVDTAFDAKAALELLAKDQSNYDIALIDDLLAPEADQEPEPLAVMLTKEIKSRYPETEVIVFTGRGMGSALEALRSGAYRYLTKPLNFEELEMLIQTAVEHRRLKSVAHEKQILEQLMQSSPALLSRQSLTQVLDVILKGVQAIGFDRVCLYLLSENRKTMIGTAQVNVGEQFVGHKRPVSKDKYMQILLSDPRPHIFERRNNRSIPYERVLKRKGVKQWACIPLIVQGKVIGKLSMDNKVSQRPIVKSELRLTDLFAAQAATAIENARLKAKEQEDAHKIEQRAHQLEILNKINKRISAALDLEDVLEAILREGLQSIGTDSGSIMLANPVTNELEMKIWIIDGELKDKNSFVKLSLVEGVAGRVMGTGTSYNCPNVAQDTYFKELPNSRNCGSLLSVPIVSHGRILGVINADNKNSNFFKDSDAVFLSELISHLVVPIESQILRNVVRSLAALPLDEILQKITESACILLGTKSGTVTLVSEETGHPTQAVRLSSSTIDKFSPRQDGLTHLVIASGQPIVIPNTKRDSRVKQSTKNKGIKSIMGVPLKIRSESNEIPNFRVIGALFVNGTQKQQFSQRDLELLQELAGQLAILIENARLGRVVKERDHSKWMASQLLALHQITRAMQSELALPRLLNLISEQTAKLLDTDSAGILLLDDQKQYLTFKGAYNLSKKVTEGTRDEIGESIAGRAVQTGRAMIANNLPSEPRFFNPSADEEGWLAIISTPLVAGGEIIGTLDGHSRSDRYAFNEDDLQILSLMATQAAIAIQNTRLFEQTHDRAHTLGELHQTALEITGYRQMPELLNSILERAVELLGAKGGGLYALAEDSRRFTLVESSGDLSQFREETFEIEDSVVSQVIQIRQPVFISDYRNWPHRMPQLDACNFTAVVGAPITWQDKIWGVIVVHDVVEDQIFGPEQQNLLAHLGNLAAVALENAELIHQDTSKLHRLERLAQVNGEIMGNLADMPLNERLNLVARHATEILRAETSAIFLVKRPDYLSLEASYGHREGEFEKGREFAIQSHPKSGLNGHIAFEGKLFSAYGETLRTHSAAQWQGYHGQSEDLYSVLAIPLIKKCKNKNRLIGLLRVDNKKDESGKPKPAIGFSKEDEWILHLFADAVVTAIEGAELVVELSEQTQLLTALDEASRHIRAEKETAKLLPEVVRLAAELVGCTAGGLCINRSQLQELDLQVVYELPDVLIGHRFPYTEGIIGLTAQTGQAQIIYDYDKWSDREDIFEAYHFQTVVGIPLKHAGEVEAVLFVACTTNLHRLTQTNLEILERFAAKASIVLQTSRLMSREQRMFGQLAILHKIGDYIQVARDLDKILHVILTGVTAGYGLSFNRAVLLLLDETRDHLVGRMGIGYLTEAEAWEDWAHHHRHRREDFQKYLMLLEQDALPITPLGERIDGLQIPLAEVDHDIFSQIVHKQSWILINQNEAEKIPDNFVQAFKPALPLIVVPLIAREQVIGLLVADNKFTRSPITSEDINSLLMFANTAAVAIDNTQLLYETNIAQERLNSFFEASNALVSSHNPKQVLQDIIEQALVAAKADGGSLILIDQMGQAQYLITVGTDDTQVDISNVVRPNGYSIQVMHTGQPEIIEDTSKKPDINPSVFWRNISAALCLPVSLEGRRIGVMWLHYSKARHFLRSEVAALQLYVNQAAIAYDSSRRIKELDYMRQASEALASVAELPQVLKQIVQSACEVLEADSASTLFYDVSQNRFVVDGVVASGIPTGTLANFLQGRAWTSPTDFAVLEQKWAGVGDIEDKEKYPFLGQLTQDFLNFIEARSFQGVALSVDDIPLGILYVNYKRIRNFNEDERKIAETFANHAALALTKAKLLDQVRKAHNATRVVAEVTVLEDPQSTLESIVKEIYTVLGCDVVTLYTYDQDLERFGFPPAMVGVQHPEQILAPGRVTEQSVIHNILPLDDLYVAENRPTDPLMHDPFSKSEEILSSVAVPLITRDSKVGVMIVSYRSRHHFTDDELLNIKLFAYQAAVAIRNAQLYDQVQKRARALQALNEAGRAITSSLDLDKILSIIVEQAWTFMNAYGEQAHFSHLALINNNKLVFAATYPKEQLQILQERVGDIDLTTGARIGVTGRAVISGKSQLVGNTTDNPDYIEYTPESRSELAVPIKVEEQAIGVINLEHSDLNVFDKDDQRALEALATQAGIAIQNATLYRQKEQHAQHMVAIANISRIINTSLDLDITLNTILTSVRSLIDYRAAEICRWDEDRQAMIVFRQVGDPRYTTQANGKYSLDEGYTGWIVRHKKPLLIKDCLNRKDIKPKVMDQERPIRSYLGVPLQADDVSIVTLELVNDFPNAFDHHHERLLTVIGEHAITAIRNAQLYEREQKRVGLRQTLYEAGRLVTSSLELDKILTRIVEQAWGITRYQGKENCFACIRLIEASTSRMVSAYPRKKFTQSSQVYNLEIDLEQGINERIGITGRAAKQRQPQLVNDVTTDPDYLIGDLETRSELVVPIEVDNEVFGVISVQHADFNAFDEEDQRVLEALAAQAASAIQNARLYQEATERLHEVNALHQAAIVLAGVSELEEVLSVIIYEAMSLTNTQESSVLFWDAKKEKFTRALRINPKGVVEWYTSQSRHRDGRARKIIDKRRTIVIPDAQQIPDFNPTFIKKGYRASLGTPLLSGGDAIGVLYVRDDKPRSFSERQITLLESLASVAAVAIDRAGQYEEMKKIKGYIGTHTAVDWIKMVHTAWGHNINREVGTALGRVALLQSMIKKGNVTAEMRDELEQLKIAIKLIKEIPITAPLSYEDAIDSVQINKLLKSYLDLQWTHNRYKSVELHYKPDKDLDQVTIRASREWLRRGLELVIDNAIRAMDKSERQERQLIVATQLLREAVEISITDTGPGISPNIAKRLFKKPIPKPKGSRGSGIGLMLAQTIFQTYRGDIRLEATSDKGTTMVITLPIETAQKETVNSN